MKATSADKRFKPIRKQDNFETTLKKEILENPYYLWKSSATAEL